MRNLILALISFVLTTACSKTDTVQLCNFTSSTCITFITQDSIRFVIPGAVDEIPSTNFASLNVGNLDPLADAIFMCWMGNDKWEITIDKAVLLENLLDSSQHKIFTALPTDKRGIPTAIDFAPDNCAVFDYELMRLVGAQSQTQATVK